MFRFLKALARLSEVEEQYRKLKARQDDVELEWASYLDKFKRIMHRIAKRAEIVENQERQENGEPGLVDSGPAPTVAASPGWARLTPRQKQIQMQIMNRRASNGGA